MTIQEFNKQKWGVGMSCIYQEAERDIISVDFIESLVGLKEDDSIQWVRCENINLLTY